MAINDRGGACLIERMAQTRGIVAFATEQVSHMTGVFDEGARSLDVADDTRRQRECIETTNDVDERMYLCVQPPRNRPVACAGGPPSTGTGQVFGKRGRQTAD